MRNRSESRLVVIMYHYVREDGHELPFLNSVTIKEFKNQLAIYKKKFEPATLESAISFLQGKYVPKKDMCLLTFDDGLMDHYSNVLPVLKKNGFQGVFFLSTLNMENKIVLSVHKNHLLKASLGFSQFQKLFLNELNSNHDIDEPPVDDQIVKKIYVWDNIEVGRFKYRLNYLMDSEVRDSILARLFSDRFGDESDYSRKFYLGWNHAREMQKEKMVIGGHTHSHVVLSKCGIDEQEVEISNCIDLLRQRLLNQEIWAFSYPFGKKDTYDLKTIRLLKKIGCSCAFSTEIGHSYTGDDLYNILRIDPKHYFT